MERRPLPPRTLRHLIENLKLPQWQVAVRFGCSRDHVNRECQRLGIRTQRTGPRSGRGHPNWNGGATMQKGYRYIWAGSHPQKTKSGYVLEHRLVMEKKLGRYLRPDEVVHHRNGNRADNRPSNLVLFLTNGDHLSHELSGDPVQSLAISCRMKRSAILASLADGDSLPPPMTAHSLDVREKAVRRACAQLRIPLPSWFDAYFDPRRKRDLRAEQRKRARNRASSESAGPD